MSYEGKKKKDRFDRLHFISESDPIMFAIAIVNLGDARAGEGPLVKDLFVGDTPPENGLNRVSLVEVDGRVNGEKHLKPREHACGKGGRVDGNVHVLVQFAIKVAAKPMEHARFLDHPRARALAPVVNGIVLVGMIKRKQVLGLAQHLMPRHAHHIARLKADGMRRRIARVAQVANLVKHLV